MISLIVPVYNVEKYLKNCLDSILNQSYSDFELILVDDGSTDQSGKICDEAQKMDSRIRVLHKENGGLSSARNAGTRLARGEELAYIDSDDMIHPDYLKILLQNLEKTGADISVCRYVDFEDQDPFGKMPETEKLSVISGREAVEQIVGPHLRYMITAWGKLYKAALKELLIYPEGKIHEDEYVTYQVFYHAEKLAVTDRPLYGYRQNPNSIMHVYSPKHLDGLEGIEGSVNWLKERGEDRLSVLAEKRYLLSIEIQWYKAKKGNQDPSFLDALVERHTDFYNRHKSILSIASFKEKAMIRMFRLSPKLYELTAGLYIQLFGTE